MSITIGHQAPPFTLYSSEKTQLSLQDFRGKTVLILFFPLAFTSVCTAELCAIRDNISLYNHANAQVLGISVDSPQTLAEFKKQQNLNFPLLSDFNKEASIAYDTIYEIFSLGMKGVSKRSAFIVDATGKLAYAEVLENAGEQPDFQKINELLAKMAS